MTPNEWLTMIERSYSRINRNPERPPDEDLETHAALYLAAVAKGKMSWEHAVQDELMLTVRLLRRFPAETGVPYLDPIAALEAFLTDLPISAAEARELVPRWTELDIADIKRLRYLKNRIAPLLFMREHLPEGVIDEWAELHPRLP